MANEIFLVVRGKTVEKDFSALRVGEDVPPFTSADHSQNCSASIVH